MSDDQNHNRPLEEELNEFPNYEMNPKKADEIYENVLNTARQMDIKDQRRNTMNKVAVALTSVAAVIVIAFASINMFDQVFTNELNESSSTAENSADDGGFDASSEDSTNTNEDSSSDNADTPELSDEEIIKQQADEVINHIAQKNTEDLSKMVHEEKGLLFSPYVNISEQAQVFNLEQVDNFLNDSKTYTWGTQDGSGKPIELTPADYFEEYIYDRDYKNADEVLYDENKTRGTMKNNINEVFPNSKVVEYYIEPSEEGGMDWNSLNLVFQENSEGEWKLVAIVHDQWTI
ncbi:hypothetical protein E3U55_12685 [Filobacillus milosensis]|uniref:Uncharacterized protein n=1 Tax=Filobacillus milosensis TaxID=94137 RepID=A0A4Y8IFB2_9BACI|nr:hypothetical protein [Filobacillus milosensis]TFB15102.1 hypothetical protein E3U55_12685 [Filobacillus milosensis]